ncbi:metallophosphoesterase family protein [Rhizorhabdus dicambivorans]|uniref:Metallophosphoesterase n=1 Tax=Rhizorhabdus dicambivorans TaxID=1850238 RepID=A0A2A4FXD3_9SPHN|nr:metallophosphoesterase [Rhizorhabdus dicambivorans]ATE63738.1 metallophosphoesterase [Rhizorhabdus dicambivorans]PCE42868.1 metallophosphoesterase [Rhizorhabdus dicambivorans]
MIRLFHVSDLHFGCADEAALDWFAGAVAAERPDAVAVTGDLTMRARAAEFEAAARWLESLDVPMTIEPGNHDLPWNPISRLLRPYRRFRRLERHLEKPLDLPGLWLVPLKTTARAQWRHNWSWGVVSRRSLDAALTLLHRRPPDAVAVIAAHHPLVDRDDIRSRGRTLRGQEALAQLAAAGAGAVLSGHVHDPFDAEIEAGGRAIRVIGAGTLSQRTRASRPSFNMLTIDGGRIETVPRTMG